MFIVLLLSLLNCVRFCYAILFSVSKQCTFGLVLCVIGIYTLIYMLFFFSFNLEIYNVRLAAYVQPFNQDPWLSYLPPLTVLF